MHTGFKSQCVPTYHLLSVEQIKKNTPGDAGASGVGGCTRDAARGRAHDGGCGLPG